MKAHFLLHIMTNLSDKYFMVKKHAESDGTPLRTHNIYRLQKIAIRIIGGIRRGSSSRPFCKKYSILHLPEIYKLTLSIFMFKFHKSLLPATFDNLFSQNRNFHSYPTRNSHLLRAPKVKTRLAENFVTKQGVLIWNEITTKFEVNTSLNIFKNNLKRYLFSSY